MVKVHAARCHVRCITSLVACLAFALSAQTARANLYDWTDGSLHVQANMDIAGGELTVVLRNLSPATQAPSAALTSFYFDIAGAPTLTYLSATGYVIGTGVNLGTADDLGNTSFRAPTDGQTNYKEGHADGWQFKTMASFDYGIGTAGNSALPDGDTFNGNVVDGLDFAIITGDGASENLKERYLVQDMATFTFGGLNGYTNDALGPVVAFGFGTAPDTFVQTPLPGAVLLGFMGLSVAGLKLRKYA